MVGYWPTVEVTGNRELGFDSAEEPEKRLPLRRQAACVSFVFVLRPCSCPPAPAPAPPAPPPAPPPAFALALALAFALALAATWWTSSH